MQRVSPLTLAAAAALAFFGSQASAVVPGETIYEPAPYTSFADSPFSGLSVVSYFHLEKFELADPRTPGYSSPTSGFIAGASSLTDSVDADDGSIDGTGQAGRSWYSANTTNTITFVFDAIALGTLPTHAGIVWTDVGEVSSGTMGVTDVTFLAYRADNTLIGNISGLGLGDGSASGGTAEDRFFGAYSAGGIARIDITVSNSVDWEVDHLQYGTLNPVPEPHQWLLFALGLAGVAAAAKRRGRAA
jgi:hypothetical protein